MCRRRFVSGRSPLALLRPLERRDTRELTWAIGSRLLLRATRVRDPTKLRRPVRAYQCRCYPWQIAGHPSSAGNLKPKSVNFFSKRSEQSRQVLLWCAAFFLPFGSLGGAEMISKLG